MSRATFLFLGAVILALLLPSRLNATIPAVGDSVHLQFKAVDGTPISTEALHGKLVVVDFWATWCGPCMGMVPHMVEMNQKYASKGLQIVGISLDSDRALMMQTTKEQGMVWPEYFDGGVWNNKIFKQYGGTSIPFTILLSPEGTVLFAGHPASGLDGAIEKAFKDHPPMLVDPKLVADADKMLAQVEGDLTAGDTTAAIKQLAKVPPTARLDHAFADRQDKVQAKLQSAANAMLSDVQAQIDQGKYVESVARLKDLSNALYGLPEAAKAKLMLSGLMSKPEVRETLARIEKDAKANDALEIAKKLQAQKKHELAYGRFLDVVKFFPGTDAATAAQAQLAIYQKDAAFMKRLADSAVSSKALAALHMGDNYRAAGNADMARKKYQAVIADFPNTTYAEQAQKALAALESP